MGNGVSIPLEAVQTEYLKMNQRLPRVTCLVGKNPLPNERSVMQA